jgi:hypothetical protein
MTDAELKALAYIEQSSDLEGLRTLLTRARGTSEAVEKAAFKRLVAVTAPQAETAVAQDCWAMVHAVEELRRAAGRKVSRMNRMRPKIDKDGEIAALEYCAINETDGFAEIMAYGMPELTAEAIVLRHPSHFSSLALSAAQARLDAYEASS